MCINAALPADSTAGCSSHGIVQHSRNFTLLLPLPAPEARKAARGSDGDAEMFPRSCGIASVPILLSFRSFVACPLFGFPAASTPWLCWGLPCRENGILSVLYDPRGGDLLFLDYSSSLFLYLGVFPLVSLAQLGNFSRKKIRTRCQTLSDLPG